MISPSPGRVVWYRCHSSDSIANVKDQPLAAIVTSVHNDRLINIALFDANGNTHPRTSVTLKQEGDKQPAGGYCEWMPYQIGQANATKKV